MIWLGLGILCALAMALVWIASRRVGVHADATDSSPAIVADQLRELDRDVANGVINAVDAQAARIELQRALLRQDRARPEEPWAQPRGSRAGLLVAVLFIPFLAFGYYAQFGAPGMARVAVADQAAARAEQNQVIALAAQLKERLETDPGGGPSEGWMLLGQTYARLGWYAEAADAYRVVTARPDPGAAVYTMLAEVLVARENGIVTPAVSDAISAAQAIDPSSPAVTYYRALELQQSGRSAAAHDLLLERLRAADGYYPWMETLTAQANRIAERLGRPALTMADFAPVVAAPGPSVADVAAAQDLSPEDRAAFIQSMVTRLADRLEEAPDDLDGWMRLGRAYTVLGNTEDARDAYSKAEVLSRDLPTGDARRAAILQSLEQIGD